jgi:RNA polymerase sigma-70 factor (ECF subfamily)
MAPDDIGADSPASINPIDREDFERFTRRLIGLARRHLDERLQHKIDPEDVVQSAYKSLYIRYGDELFSSQAAGDLWRLLALITVRKCADRVRYHTADCRDLGREAVAAAPDEPEPWRDAVGREPTPEHAAVLAETVEQVLRDVDPDERPIIEMSLQGYSTQEVSQQIGRAERSVRRLRERVRKQLERLHGAAAP